MWTDLITDFKPPTMKRSFEEEQLSKILDGQGKNFWEVLSVKNERQSSIKGMMYYELETKRVFN